DVAFLGELLDQLGAFDGDTGDAVLVHPEHHPALQRGGGAAEVADGLLGAAERLEGAFDQLGPGLGEHLDHHVVGDPAFFDDLAYEVEVGLGGGREADFDLLVAHPYQQLEHLELAVGVHRVDQRLVAVTQVDGAPARRLGDDLVGPGAVGQPDRLERLITMERHRAGLLGGHRGAPDGRSEKKAADAHDWLRGEGAGLYRPPPRQLRSSPRSMRFTLPDVSAWAGHVLTC